MEAGLPELSSLRQASLHSSEITQIFPLPGASAPTTGRAITVSKAGQVLLWTLKDGRRYELLSLQSGIVKSAFIEKRSLLAVAYPTKLVLYSLNKQAELATLGSIKGSINDIAFDPDGNMLLIAASDGRVYQWQFYRLFKPELMHGLSPFEKDKILEAYIGHSAVVSAVLYHPEGRFFFSGDWQGVVSAWLKYSSDPFGGEYDTSFFSGRFFAEEATRMTGSRSDQQAIDHLAISDDGQSLLVGVQSGFIELWSVRGLKGGASIQAHTGILYDLAITADGSRAASVARDGHLKIWKLTLGISDSGLPAQPKIELLQELEMPDSRSVVFTGNSDLLVGTEDGKLLSVHLNG